MSASPVHVEFSVNNDVDKQLYRKENIITSDAIILDQCASWFNLVRRAVRLELGAYPYIEIVSRKVTVNGGVSDER